MQVPRQFVVALIAAIAVLTSCRNAPSRPQNSAMQQQVTAAHATVERTLTPEEQSCERFVQNFYDWYVHKELADECAMFRKDAKQYPGFTDSTNSCERANKLASAQTTSLKLALSPKLKRLLDEDAAAQSKDPGEIIGLDGDPFLNGNGGAIYDYVVDSAQMKGGECYATVNEIGIDGNQEERGKIYDRIIVELSNSHGKWIIDNLQYHLSDVYDPARNVKISYDEDLIHELKGLGVE